MSGSATTKAKRMETLRRVAELEAGGMSFASAAARCGGAAATLRRWREMYAEAGFDGLEGGKSSGRPAIAACMTEEVKNALRRKAIKCGSTALSYKWLKDDPECPEELREYLQNKEDMTSLPLSLHRAANVIPEAEARYRGRVAYGHVGYKSRHSDRVIDPGTGRERELLAGDIFISDDMSINYYFWFELADGERATRAGRGDRLAEKHGVGIGRQVLYTIDARGKWLGATLIGCVRDAYTTADILRHFRSVTNEFGRPRLEWVLEQGCWKAYAVTGKRKRILVNEDEVVKIVAGLSTLGFHVEYVHTSEGKALIEGAFKHHQQIMDLLEDVPTCGHVRGEMEENSKLFTRIQHGVVHPKDAGLLHINAMSEIVRKTMVFGNSNKKNGRIQKGVPDERWFQDVKAHPLRQLEARHAGVFMPLKHETMIDQGHVQKKLDGDLFRFCAPEIFPVLGRGYRLLVAFDPTDPYAGAEIFNMETGSRNDGGYAPGQWICHAEYDAARPLFGYTDEVAEGVKQRKRYQRAFQAAWVGTGIFGKRATKMYEQRDGKGNAAKVEIGKADNRNAHTDIPREDAKPQRDIPVISDLLKARARGLSRREWDERTKNLEAREAELMGFGV